MRNANEMPRRHRHALIKRTIKYEYNIHNSGDDVKCCGVRSMNYFTILEKYSLPVGRPG
jgi:hypothetical protein